MVCFACCRIDKPVKSETHIAKRLLIIKNTRKNFKLKKKEHKILLDLLIFL